MVVPKSRQGCRIKRFVLLGLFALVVLILFFVVFFSLQNQTKEKVLSVGLDYAQKDCSRRNEPQDICDNLFAETTAPNWGPDWWVVDIYSGKDASFSGSARVEINKGRARVIDYSINQ